MASNSSSVLYIGAIPFNWDVDVVKSVVCGSGPVVDVRCMMDNASKNKGFCFVEFTSPETAQNALRTLNRVKIEGRKKMRIELSKEGLRNSTGKPKPTIPLDRMFLPSNVILPSEMLSNVQQAPMNNLGAAAVDIQLAITQNPQIQQMVGQMLANGMDMVQISSMVAQYQQGGGAPTMGSNILSPPPPPSTLSGNTNHPGGSLNQHLYNQQPQNVNPSGIPQSLLMASQFLLLPSADLRQELSKNKVSDTLSNIPPGVLIELLAKLKMMLSQQTPNYMEAAKILTENPQLAVAAAQSLLLMGIIDLEVINQAMNQQQTQQPQVQSQSPNHIQSNVITSPSPSTLPIAPPAEFPPHTMAKLAKMSPQESNLIIQILKLAPHQIAALPPNERDLAMSLRSQYL